MLRREGAVAVPRVTDGLKRWQGRLWGRGVVGRVRGMEGIDRKERASDV